MIEFDDVEEIAEYGTQPFQIPSREMRDRLRVGELVKLHFRVSASDLVERMWVVITEVTDSGYIGLLANDPTKIGEIKCGDRVSFLSKNISSIWIDSDHEWENRIRSPAHQWS